MTWPWPETETDRLRRIIDYYRDALLEEAPTRCLELDAVMAEYGQGWITDNEIIDVNQLMTAREVSEYIQARFGEDVSVFDVRNWERAGSYSGIWRGSRKYFRLGDVLVKARNTKKP